MLPHRFAQGLDDNLRKKFGVFGVQLTRAQFLVLDHVAHTLPAALLVAACVRRGLRVHPLNSVYALGLATWFSFRQGASLDASAIYVPHPWKRLWLAGTVSMVLTPSLVNALVARRHGRAALLAATLLLPYLTTKLDPDLKKKYAFEYALQLQQARRTGPRVRQRGGRVGDLPRAQSYDPMRDSREETRARWRGAAIITFEVEAPGAGWRDTETRLCAAHPRSRVRHEVEGRG